ncbi:MAG TPA: F0F1 ATP synthase subunit B [Vicinamibacteria bacterium]|nr:F0F1 ATP synthase subunit B [Vicinamibacteria bacterium]
MAALLPAALAAAEGGFSFTDINWGISVWTVVLFVIFFVVMGKFGWGPLLKIVEEREAHIKEAIESSERANAEARSLLEKHRELVEEISRERADILKTAHKEAEQLKAELQTHARAESEKMIARARDQIEREKAQAILELRGQVADLAIAAASKIVTSSLTPEAQRKLVADFLKSIPRAQ